LAMWRTVCFMSLYRKSWLIMNGCKILMDARSFLLDFIGQILSWKRSPPNMFSHSSSHQAFAEYSLLLALGRFWPFQEPFLTS
jgi:hypothetical protein